MCNIGTEGLTDIECQTYNLFIAQDSIIYVNDSQSCANLGFTIEENEESCAMVVAGEDGADAFCSIEWWYKP